MRQHLVLTHFDVCSGLGGFALAARWAGGIDTVAFCEIEAYCKQVLAKHWPGVPIYDDLRTLDLDALPAIDLITAGFPCQPVSEAGRQLGANDERWLWPAVARCIRGVQPRWVLLENVSGLLRRHMGDVLADLAACGYDAEWDCIPAAAVGAPHIRNRVWVVAYPSRGRHQTPQAPICAGRTGTELCTWWASEPSIRRVANGLPAGVDRRRALGNAIVPQVAELILRRIVAATPTRTEPAHANA